MYTYSEEERKDGGNSGGDEEQPLMIHAKENTNYTNNQSKNENIHKEEHIYDFHYETSSELERFSIFRECLQFIGMILLVIILLPFFLVVFICFLTASMCWRKVGTTFA